ncbi:MAG: PLP-dependent aminotransferase family protein [Clostridia bacterium]|nr:PLP-dependent aminotransferase family protein [Clostridia bacterium]
MDKTPQRTEPAYLKLYRRLRREIVSGVWPQGARLPGKRVIAEEEGISVVTAEHALALLADEGYIETRPRSGNFVSFTAADAGREEPGTGHVPVGALPTRVHKGDFPFSVLAKTMRRVLLDYGERILVKSPSRGCPELRREIAAYLMRSRGIAVSEECIVVGAGAEYLYGLIAQLIPRGTVFALEDPSYETIRNVYGSMGVPCELLPMRRDGIDAAALAKTKAQVLHCTPFHSFPTGVSLTAGKKHEYLRWADARGGWIVEDNYDSELTVSEKPEDPLFALSRAGNVIYLNSFSRTVAPSMRTGYMVLPERLLPAFEERLGFYSCTVPVFEQYVLAELLHGGDFERHLNRERRKRRKEGRE